MESLSNRKAVDTSLTDEQRRIVEASPSDKLLVTAGPGTGKTHTLIARLASLIDTHGLSPGYEVLVLSFSRAAVREIRDRTAASSGNVSYVGAFTFDSFATRLLADVDPGGEWTEMDYDGRIEIAISALRTSPAAQEILQDYRHVLIDELQDLVGVRADLVMAVIESVQGGFTALGDPAQGIYNFQLKDREARAEGSAKLYRWIERRFGNDLIRCTLTENHRAKTVKARLALSMGPYIHAASLADYWTIKRKLETLISSLPSLGSIHDGAPSLLKNSSHRTAILCRTNGQALMISRHLWSSGVPLVRRRSAVDRAVPSWIGKLFFSWEQGSIGRSAFRERVETELASDTDPDLLWTTLQRVDSRPGTTTLDVTRIAERIASGYVPDDLFEQEDGDLIVSTIHRAKGLEFDRVVVAVDDSADDDSEIETVAEEARILYVALTRPRRDLFRLEIPRFNGLSRHEVADRWCRRFGWRAIDFELRAQDIHHRDPAGGTYLEGIDPLETQRYIASSVKKGQPVELVHVGSSETGAPRAFYAVEHHGRTIGLTTEEFGRRLFSFLKHSPSWRVQWPKRIRDLRVENVDTVAGLPSTGRRCGLGASGLWLRVRVSGLGNLHFS
jgi:hypothetical protein